jgi:hypothetical protein
MLKHFPALLLFALLWPLSVNAGAPKQVIGYLQGEITVAADGQVKSVTLKDTKSPELEAFFVSQIKRWEFHPVAVNGVPTDAVAPLSLTVLATFGEDRKIQKIEFRQVSIGKSDIEVKLSGSSDSSENWPIRKHIEYPEMAMRKGVSALVNIAVEIGENGHVKQAGIYDLALVNSGNRNDRSVRDFAMNTFGKSALRGVSKWFWPPKALAEDDCVGGCIRLITVSFEMYELQTWANYTGQDIEPPAWANKESIKTFSDQDTSRYVQFKTDPSNTSLDVGM